MITDLLPDEYYKIKLIDNCGAEKTTFIINNVHGNTPFTLNNGNRLQTIEIINDFAPCKGQKVRVVVVNEDGKRLSGAAFSLTGRDDDGNCIDLGLPDPVLTKDDGLIIDAELLPNGTYTLIQRATPDGYLELAAGCEKLVFRVTSDTVVVVDGGLEAGPAPIMGERNPDGTLYDGYTIRVENMTGLL